MQIHSFNTRQQKPVETIEAFVSTLRNQTKNCIYGNYLRWAHRDQLVCGISSDNVRRSLLKETDFTVAKVIRICQINELTEQLSKVLPALEHIKTPMADAMQVKHNNKIRGQFKYRGKTEDPSTTAENFPTVGIINDYWYLIFTTSSCRNCEGNHPAKWKLCPAFGQQCHNCGRKTTLKCYDSKMTDSKKLWDFYYWATVTTRRDDDISSAESDCNKERDVVLSPSMTTSWS